MAARFQSHSARIDPNLRSDYTRALQEWNARLIESQRAIRVLESIRWPNDVQHDFFARGCRELPRIGCDDYPRLPAALSPPRRFGELREIESDIQRRLGGRDPAARLLLRRCRSAQNAVQLLAARGTREFSRISRQLYGSSTASTDHRHRLTRLADFLDRTGDAPSPGARLSARAVADELSRRLGDYFGCLGVSVALSNRIASDACAGIGRLKLRQNAEFVREDIHLLETHEGWAHLGTSFNGSRQPLLTILGRIFAGATATQEGLAVLTEIVSDACHAERRRRLSSRLRAVMMAEDGADFLEVFRFLGERGDTPVEAYRKAVRVFRGSLPAGAGPFTKDLSYGFGLLALTDRLRTIAPDDFTTLPLLFCGKTQLEDLADLKALHGQGLLIGGEFIPPPFRDRSRFMAALAQFHDELNHLDAPAEPG